jgi:hypothetical protein
MPHQEIPKGYQDTAIVGFHETALTDRYALVQAQFQWRFNVADGQPSTVTLPSTFVVDRGGDSPHIVFYLNEHDVVSELRERGVLIERQHMDRAYSRAVSASRSVRGAPGEMLVLLSAVR